ncbi:MAG: ATP-binding cassette domain-containing protein [Nitrososphaeria archaeon]
MVEEKYLIQMKNIHKFFGEVHALRGVDLAIGPNEVVGLIGDNGAGKSTLVKILSGVYPWDEGEIFIEGKKIDKRTFSVKKAREYGIEVVYQERALAEKLCLWRNIYMGRELSGRLGFLRIPEMKANSNKVMKERLGFTSSAVTADARVSVFSGGEKEGVAIARALLFEAKLIILDEPTVGLSTLEVQEVLNFVKKIKETNRSCLFISHNIYHVYPVADRFALLDRGKIVDEFEKANVTLKEIEDKMARVAEMARVGKGRIES